MRRIVAIYLPFLRLEIGRISLEKDAPPTALVIARSKSAIKNERSLQGGTRLDEVNPAARILGIRPHQTIATARSKCASLRTRIVPEAEVENALFGLAEALLAFGATTSVSLRENIVWVDVTGCSHLHATVSDPKGEESLVRSIEKAVLLLGHKSRIALADGPKIAALLARYARTHVLADEGKNANALEKLSVHALPLSEDVLSWLSALGLQTIGELQKIPRSSLEKRLENAAEVMALLSGEDPTPLTAHIPPSIPEERASLEYGSESSETLLFVAKGLVDRLAARLKGRALATTHLELVLGLDRAFAKDQPNVTLEIPIATPLREPGDLLRVLRVKIEAYVVPAPILEVTLRAIATSETQAKTGHLFIPESKAARVLPSLVAELEAELGEGRVGLLTVRNRWRPSERLYLAPFEEPRAVVCSSLTRPSPKSVASTPSLGSPTEEYTAYFEGGRPTDWGAQQLYGAGLATPNMPRGALLSGATEPTRLLREPIPIRSPPALHDCFRQSMIEWWAKAPVSRTFGCAFIESFGTMAWIETSEDGHHAWIRGFVD